MPKQMVMNITENFVRILIFTLWSDVANNDIIMLSHAHLAIMNTMNTQGLSQNQNLAEIDAFHGLHDLSIAVMLFGFWQPSYTHFKQSLDLILTVRP